MEIITHLNNTRDITLSYFGLSADDLEKTYAPGKWTVKQVLVHLADAESVLHERIKRIIAEPSQVIWAFDQDMWCRNLDYENFPLEVSKDLYMANRQSVIFLAQKFYKDSINKTFVHSQTGVRTLKEEFDKVALHNSQHIHQINKAISKL